MAVAGRYFFPRSTRFVAAQASAAGSDRLQIADDAGTLLAQIARKDIRMSARLGNLPRRLDFADGSHFETTDNDGIDDLRRTLNLRAPGGVLHRLEKSWRWALASVAVAILASYLFIAFGIPAIAKELADRTPASVATVISRQTLDFLDQATMNPTALKAAEQARALKLFRTVARHAPRGEQGYQLKFRDGGAIGANAFALPDGTIVMTDQIWKLSKNDEEIEGVFGHEMSHVDHAHGLQSIYQASMIPAVIALITGDVSQVSQLATILPGILVQSSYARGFEQQADDDSAKLMLSMGAKPSHLADLLERLEVTHCGSKNGCAQGWLGSHPDTDVRAAKLRAETPK